MQTRELTPETSEQLSVWRAMALQRMPYFAPILFGLHPLDAPELGTFAVDHHWRLYIDFEAVAPKGDLWCAEALLHECGHIFGRHYDRALDAGVRTADGREVFPGASRLWNYAGDAEQNDDLVLAGCSTIAADGVLPKHLGEPDHQIAEHYFKSLRQRSKPQQGQQSGSGQQGPFKGCGSVSGGQAAPCELDEGAAPAKGATEKDRVLLATSAHIEQHAKTRGSVPAGLVAQAREHLKPPQVRWERELRACVRFGVRVRPGDQDVSYLRRNRRNPRTPMGAGRWRMNPGTVSPVPSVALVRDTSGSMSEVDLAAVTNETEGIAKQLGIRGNDLRIIDVDAQAYGARAYQGVRTMAEVQGRGGTDMCVGIEAAAALRPRPRVVIVATDGYTPWPSSPIRGSLVVACIIGTRESVATARDSVPDFIRVVEVVTN